MMAELRAWLIDLRDSLGKKRYAPPARVREGTFALADGTLWNPGFGLGLYQYLDGQWRPLHHVNPVGTLVRRSDPLSIPAATAVTVPWQSADYGQWSSSNPTRIPIPFTGLYMMGFSGRVELSTAGYVSVFYFVNGNTQLAYDLRAGDQAYPIASMWAERLSAGDYVEVALYSNRSGTFMPSNPPAKFSLVGVAIT